VAQQPRKIHSLDFASTTYYACRLRPNITSEAPWSSRCLGVKLHHVILRLRCMRHCMFQRGYHGRCLCQFPSSNLFRTKVSLSITQLRVSLAWAVPVYPGTHGAAKYSCITTVNDSLCDSLAVHSDHYYSHAPLAAWLNDNPVKSRVSSAYRPPHRALELIVSLLPRNLVMENHICP
jgi:hypothetical protein